MKHSKRTNRVKREYNSNISEKANESLSRRADAVRLQKRIIAIMVILAVSLLVLLGSSIHAFASGKDTTQPVYKYYTSIRIENGDTLWKIADTYTKDYGIDKEAYIEEICHINQLQDTQIHSGEYLVIACYSHTKQ